MLTTPLLGEQYSRIAWKSKMAFTEALKLGSGVRRTAGDTSC